MRFSFAPDLLDPLEPSVFSTNGECNTIDICHLPIALGHASGQKPKLATFTFHLRVPPLGGV